MPLIAGDTRRGRGSDAVKPSEAPGRAARPDPVTAGLNAMASVGRKYGVVRAARKETVRFRRTRCNRCDIRVVKNGREYCGHRYFDVTIGRVDVDKVQGCGCAIDRKIRDPKASCPKNPPEWGPESDP